MSISAAQVKDLREKTGMGMMECKKALEECSGDMEKAVVWLRERGMSRAQKKADRVTAQGMVEVYVNSAQNAGALVELNCETDFVAKNEDFRQFGRSVAELAMSKGLVNVDQLLNEKLGSTTVADRLTELKSKIGENMNLRRVSVIKTGNGVVTGYSHMDGKIGTLVLIEGANTGNIGDLGKDLAMHVAAASPRYMTEAEVDKSELEQEKDIAAKKLKEEGKPDNLIEKIMVGQMKKFYKEVCFIDQAFIKDPGVSVADHVKKTNASFVLKSFARFALGEGIEKKQENFAEEVAAQLRK